MGKYTATITKTKSAEAIGTYAPTTIDVAKAAADFRLVQVGPNYIVWRDGRGERVTERQLTKLQASHTWACDF